jgi:hypothetical protein
MSTLHHTYLPDSLHSRITLTSRDNTHSQEKSGVHPVSSSCNSHSGSSADSVFFSRLSRLFLHCDHLLLLSSSFIDYDPPNATSLTISICKLHYRSIQHLNHLPLLLCFTRSGGWWSRPTNWISNTAVCVVGIGLATWGVWRVSARNEVSGRFIWVFVLSEILEILEGVECGITCAEPGEEYGSARKAGADRGSDRCGTRAMDKADSRSGGRRQSKITESLDEWGLPRGISTTLCDKHSS